MFHVPSPITGTSRPAKRRVRMLSMYHRRVKRLLLAVVLAVAAACHGGNAHDDDTPLPHDPRVRVGHLANGLTYYVMKLPEATHRARLWLVVNAGSLEEDDDQRGLAHLVEHMAFRGTRKYPGEAITVFLEHAGLESGPDLDAFTSYEQTRYELAVATDQPGLVAQGFDVLHEWAGAVTFDPAAYELERTVVLEENRLRAGRRSRPFARSIATTLTTAATPCATLPASPRSSSTRRWRRRSVSIATGTAPTSWR